MRIALAVGLLAGCESARVLPPSPPAVPSPTAVAAPTPASPPPSAVAEGAMVHIPTGTFRMGAEDGKPDEKPSAPVQVAAFDMDATEVTVAAYANCAAAGACGAAPTHVHVPGAPAGDHRLDDDFCNGNRPDRRRHPVNCVDWSMADAYCRWAGKRLPTEQEWEYAPRGPQGQTFPWGSSAPTSDVLNACGAECVEAMRARGQSLRGLYQGSDHWPSTAPVASYPPGPFGLYDMAGNVWEWTASAYCPYGATTCSDPRRVARGGSWQVVDWVLVRSADRTPFDPATRNTALGFRCAR